MEHLPKFVYRPKWTGRAFVMKMEVSVHSVVIFTFKRCKDVSNIMRTCSPNKGIIIIIIIINV